MLSAWFKASSGPEGLFLEVSLPHFWDIEFPAPHRLISQCINTEEEHPCGSDPLLETVKLQPNPYNKMGGEKIFAPNTKNSLIS